MFTIFERLTKFISSPVMGLALLFPTVALPSSPVQVSYSVTSAWSSGYQASVVITNTSSAAVRAWDLQFDLPYGISSIWNAQVTGHTGSKYHVTGLSWNVDIPAGGSVDFGFIGGSYSGTSPKNPSNCLLNSQSVSSSTCLSGTAPLPPTAPIGLRLVSSSTSGAVLAWSPGSPGSNPVTGYRLYENGNFVVAASTTQASVTGLVPATTYSFTVAAVDSTGSLSPQSAPLPVTTPSGGTTPPPPTSTRLFAPYVDVTLYPTFNLTQSAASAGKNFTLAFIVDGGSCQAYWGGVIALNQNWMLSDVTSLRAQGGDVVVSFGGASGSELAQTCSSVSALQAQYQAVIDRYQLKRIDFDIEGAASADPASISRRNQAIVLLEASNPGLTVSFTLPVLPSGLTQDGINVLTDAVQKGVKLTTVNIMAMDYGQPSTHMGQDAIDAANATKAQLATLYPSRTASQLYAMLGVTPMIGINDVASETFTLSDAQTLQSFAKTSGLGFLSMWSATRDRACSSGGNYAQPNCSGVPQSTFAFAAIFKQTN